MNKNSSSYIIIYVTVMVVVVAFVLAFTAGMLKERQDRNIEVDKKKQILAALNVDATSSNAEALYEQYVKKVIVVNYRGELIEEINGFTIDLEIEHKKAEEEKFLPVYIGEKNGQIYYVFSLYGAGLWGAIWGYISLKEDRNTVYGVHISHKAETPGLGAEIADRHFHEQFQGKEIFKGGKFKSIAIVKPGRPVEGTDFVDGISGGTITSQAVDKMLFNSLGWYKEFLVNN